MGREGEKKNKSAPNVRTWWELWVLIWGLWHPNLWNPQRTSHSRSQLSHINTKNTHMFHINNQFLCIASRLQRKNNKTQHHGIWSTVSDVISFNNYQTACCVVEKRQDEPCVCVHSCGALQKTCPRHNSNIVMEARKPKYVGICCVCFNIIPEKWLKADSPSPT